MDKLLSYLPEILFYGLLFTLIYLLANRKEKLVKRKILVISGVIFLVLFAVHSWSIYNSLGELKKIQKEIQALDLPVTLEEAVMNFSKQNFKPEDNAAIVFKQYKSCGWLGEGVDIAGVPQKQIIYPKVSTEKKKQFDKIGGRIKTGKDLNAGNVAFYKEYVEYNKNFLDAYRSLANYKYTYFNIDLKNPHLTCIPDFLVLRSANEIFVQKIVLDIREGKYDLVSDELEEYQKINNIVNFNTHTWLLNSMIGIAVNGLSLMAMEDLIEKKDVTITQRLRLIKLLNSVFLKTKDAFIRSNNNERIAFNVWTECDRILVGSKEEPAIFGSSTIFKLYASYTFRPLMLKERVFANLFYLRVLKSVSAGCYEKQLSYDTNRIRKEIPVYFALSRMLIFDLGQTARQAFIELNRINETIFRLMMENFKAVRGRYPENVPELRTLLGSDCPMDIMSCSDFKFKKTSAGYEIIHEWEMEMEKAAKAHP